MRITGAVPSLGDAAVSKHTPGHWTHARLTIFGPDALGQPIVCELRGSWEFEDVRANARLIAAAPEMHELLHAIVSNAYAQDDRPFDRAIEDAKALLARIDGGEG